MHGLIAPEHYRAAYDAALTRFVETGRGGVIG